jgi:hypothetical protein
MSKIEIVIPQIPHGHGLSYKKGVADGLLDAEQFQKDFHKTHSASYQKGREVGITLKNIIAQHVV